MTPVYRPDLLTITERLATAAEVGNNITVIDGDSHTTSTWLELHTEARAFAAALQAQGVREGTHVALMGPTTRDLLTTLQAIWLCGGVLVMMPLPMRMGSLERFIEQTRDRMRFAEVSVVVMDPQLSAFLSPEPGDPPLFGYDDLRSSTTGLTADDWTEPNIDPDSLAVLQFTSGSTSEPKGVMLSHRQICLNLDGAASRGEMRYDDVFVTWLPLYHDMGLIGLLGLPMTSGRETILAAPQDFLAKPARWMQWMHDFKATVTAGPNFAFALATRSLKRAEDLDLSNIRVFLCGAEPIDAPTFREFLDAAGQFGASPLATFACFGMAEVCIAGTFPHPFTGLRTDIVDADALETEFVARAPRPHSDVATRELVLLGKPIEGLEMRIVHPETGEVLGDRGVGELQIRGTSVTSGYYRNPEATAELFDGEWLRTGDLAYLLHGDLVMCGRIKDVIIIGGRNIHPQDIEVVAATVEGVRPGNVIAFGIDDSKSSQHIVIIAEARTDDPEGVRKAITRAVSNDIGVPPREVLLLKPGTIAKTSSGKLQRSLAKTEYRDGALELLEG